ncbi:MAG: TolC family protein [Candidatus Acidiferrum sp.]
MNHEWIAHSVRTLASAVILFVGVTPLARAQEKGTAPPLRLEQVVRLALQQNPAFQTSADEAEAARARQKQAQGAWFPRIDFHQDFTRGNNPVYVFGTKLTQRQFSTADFAPNKLNTPTPIDNFQTRLDGQWRLFDSGQTLFHQRSAKRLVTAADFETEQARQDLILEIVRAYYGVLVSKENAKAADGALKTAESSAQRMETMHKAGLLVDSDLLSAKVFVSQMKDRQIRAQNDLALAKMQLAREMGTALDAPAEPAETLVEPGMPAKTIEEWIHIALEQRPGLRAAQLQETAMGDERKAARAEFGPKVGLFGSTERDAMALGGPSGTNWTAGARLDFNIFAGGAQKARVAEAVANENKAKHNVEWFRSGVQMEVRKAYLDGNAAAQRAAAARDAADQAKESLRIVQNRYEAGLTTVTELLRSQTAQLDAATGYLAALQDWQVAGAQLERAAGVLTPESALITGAGKP